LGLGLGLDSNPHRNNILSLKYLNIKKNIFKIPKNFWVFWIWVWCLFLRGFFGLGLSLGFVFFGFFKNILFILRYFNDNILFRIFFKTLIFLGFGLGLVLGFLGLWVWV